MDEFCCWLSAIFVDTIGCKFAQLTSLSLLWSSLGCGGILTPSLSVATGQCDWWCLLILHKRYVIYAKKVLFVPLKKKTCPPEDWRKETVAVGVTILDPLVHSGL